MHPLFEDQDRPLLFGHRGFSELAPENTLEAFRLCVERGISGVELDVHLCKTGELVIIHDHDLKRVAGYGGTVEELTFDQLRSLDVGSHKAPQFKGARIPLLSELFAECGDRLYYDIELKAKGIKDTHLAWKTWTTIQEYHLEHRCMVSSFNPFSLRYFNRVSHRALPTAVIYSESKEVPRILQHGWGRFIAQATVLKPEHVQVTDRMLAKYRKGKGYPVSTWTISSKEEAKRVLDLGVDGIICNNPGLFLDEVRGRFQR